MIRKLASLLLVLCVTAALVPALAADNGADPLTWVELQAWTEGLVTMTENTAPYNDPADEDSLTDDGYAFIYEFGTLFFSRPDRGPGSALVGAVVYDDAVDAPRGTDTLTTLNGLVASYYNENETLAGTHDEAILYAGGNADDGFWWAALERDGQHADTVQYTVHEPLGGGEYTDAGLVYTLQENTVVAIRAYGLDRRVTLEEIGPEMDWCLRLAEEDGYAMFPTSADGTGLAPFGRDDLRFAGIDFLTSTAEEAMEALGEPDFDDRLELDGQTLRVLGYQDFELVFDTADGERLRSFAITGGELEGPRGMRIGDSLQLVSQRFPFGQGGVEGTVETLYGTPGEGSWGTAEHGDGAATILRYGFTLPDGRQIVLMASFEMLALNEIMVY